MNWCPRISKIHLNSSSNVPSATPNTVRLNEPQFTWRHANGFIQFEWTTKFRSRHLDWVVRSQASWISKIAAKEIQRTDSSFCKRCYQKIFHKSYLSTFQRGCCPICRKNSLAFNPIIPFQLVGKNQNLIRIYLLLPEEYFIFNTIMIRDVRILTRKNFGEKVELKFIVISKSHNSQHPLISIIIHGI